MLLSELAAVSHALAATRSRTEKRDRLAALLREMSADELEIGVAFLVGEPRQGRIGVGWASVADAEPGAPAASASLTLEEVDRAISELSKLEGSGSKAERKRALEALLWSLPQQTPQPSLKATRDGPSWPEARGPQLAPGETHKFSATSPCDMQGEQGHVVSSKTYL